MLSARNHARHTFHCMLLLLVLISAPASLTSAEQDKRADLAKLFDKREVMISVRDGVKLHTEIYTPKDAKEPLPMLLDRTPYGISAPDKGLSNNLFRYSDMFADGYIFVFQDISRALRLRGQIRNAAHAPDPGDPKGVERKHRHLRHIEWLVKNVANNNGRVGMNGIPIPAISLPWAWSIRIPR